MKCSDSTGESAEDAKPSHESRPPADLSATRRPGPSRGLPTNRLPPSSERPLRAGDPLSRSDCGESIFLEAGGPLRTYLILKYRTVLRRRGPDHRAYPHRDAMRLCAVAAVDVLPPWYAPAEYVPGMVYGRGRLPARSPAASWIGHRCRGRGGRSGNIDDPSRLGTDDPGEGLNGSRVIFSTRSDHGQLTRPLGIATLRIGHPS